MSNVVECGACGAPVRFGHSEEDCETIKELRATARAAHATGRAAGLREAAEAVLESEQDMRALADNPVLHIDTASRFRARAEALLAAHTRILALLGPGDLE